MEVKDKNSSEYNNPAVERVIESIAKNMDLYGVPPSVGRLYAVLYFSSDAMTLDDMKNVLQMSKTSMSTGIKTLMDLNCVEKVWKKGDRKDYYRAKMDWRQTFVDFFSIQWKKAAVTNMETISKSIAEIEQQLTNPNLSHAEQQLLRDNQQKMASALTYYRWLREVIRNFEQHSFELPK